MSCSTSCKMRVALLLVSLALAGCATSPFWQQCIKANAYGFSMFTAYGPFNLGYVFYERNVNCGADAIPIHP